MTRRAEDLRRIVAARFLSRAGSHAAFFVGVWGKAAFILGASAYSLAGVMFVVSISMILGSLVAGVLVDRFGPRRVLVYAEWLFVPAALAVALANTLPVLTVLVAIWAFASAPVQTAAASFAPYLTDDAEELRGINAWIEGAGSLSFAVGPAVGALVVTYAHVNWVFVIDAATSLVAAILVYGVSLTPPPREGRGDAQQAVRQMIDGMRVVYGLRTLRYYVLAGTLVWVAFGAFGALEPLFFRDVVGTDIAAMGWMNTIFGTGFVLGAVVLPRLPKGIVSARGLAVTVGLTGLGTVLYVGWPDLRVIAVGAFVWSTVIGVMEPLLRTLLHRDSPRHLVGRVMGVAEVNHRAGEIIPLAFAPALAAAFGVQATLIAGGLVATVVALGSYREARGIDADVARAGVPEPELEGIRAADEPFLPMQ